jgi:hypothetical protein
MAHPWIAAFALLAGCSATIDQVAPDGPGSPARDAAAGGDSSAACGSTFDDLAGCSCTPGGQRACYGGPPATRGVGACRDGAQTCAGSGEFGGTWTACASEVLPASETGHCGDGIDNDCNGVADCQDGACDGDQACFPVDMSKPGDMSKPAGCVMPDNQLRCPEGTYLNLNAMNGMLGCCPCDATTCGKPACCVTQACAGSQACGMCNGVQLDPACMGRVDGDCDDFPEDCDQLCCPCKPAGKCTLCPQGHIFCNGVCVDAVSDPNHCGACDRHCPNACVNASCT